MTVTVSIRGQIVIPSEIRKRYHITPASRLEFVDTGKELPASCRTLYSSRGFGVTTTTA